MKSLYWSPKCTSCFNCKKRRFTTEAEMFSFAKSKGVEIRDYWSKKFQKNGFIEFFWCSIETPQRLRVNRPGTGTKRIKGMFCKNIDA